MPSEIDAELKKLCEETIRYDEWATESGPQYASKMAALAAAAAPLARALLLRLEAEAWRDISTAPKDGTPIIVARDMEAWGWVRGTAYWTDFRGIAGWVSRGFSDPPGELGLAHPTHWKPCPTPPERLHG